MFPRHFMRYDLYQVFLWISFGCVVFCLSFLFHQKLFSLSCEQKRNAFSYCKPIEFKKCMYERERDENATTLNSAHFNVNVYVPFAWWHTHAILHWQWDETNKVRRQRMCSFCVFKHNKIKRKAQFNWIDVNKTASVTITTALFEPNPFVCLIIFWCGFFWLHSS